MSRLLSQSSNPSLSMRMPCLPQKQHGLSSMLLIFSSVIPISFSAQDGIFLKFTLHMWSVQWWKRLLYLFSCIQFIRHRYPHKKQTADTIKKADSSPVTTLETQARLHTMLRKTMVKTNKYKIVADLNNPNVVSIQITPFLFLIFKIKSSILRDVEVIGYISLPRKPQGPVSCF